MSEQQPEKPADPHRHNIRTIKRNMRRHQDEFLAAFRTYGTDTHAIESVGLTIQAFYLWKQNDPEFVSRYNEALQWRRDALKRSGFLRALNGTKRPIYQGGKLVGHETVYSDRIWEILAKAWDKEIRAGNESEIPKLFADDLVARIVMLINARLPQTCPHCKTLLNLRGPIVEELKKLSVSVLPTEKKKWEHEPAKDKS